MAAPKVRHRFPNGINRGAVRDFMVCGTRDILEMGGANSGKSEAALRRAYLFGLMNPGARILIGQPLLKETKEFTIPHFFDIIEPELFTNYVSPEKFVNRDPLVLMLHNRATFTFTGFNQQTGFGSVNAALALIDEAYHPLGGHNLPELTYRAVQKGMRQPGIPWHGTIIVTNPPPEDHWLHDEFGYDGKLGKAVFKLSLEDNERNLPKSHVAALQRDFTGALYEVMVKGDWGEVVAGQAAFTLFAPDFHVQKGLLPDPKYPLDRSWDFGFRHPFVTWHQIVDGQWRILHCYSPRDVMIDALIDGVAIQTAGLFQKVGQEMRVRDCGDPEAKHRTDKGVTLNFLRRKGIRLQSLPTRPIEEGVQHISHWQGRVLSEGRPAFVVAGDGQCEPVIQAFSHGFRRSTRRDGTRTDQFVNDGYFKDCVDTCRYYAQNFLSDTPSAGEKPPRRPSFGGYGNTVPASHMGAGFGSWGPPHG